MTAKTVLIGGGKGLVGAYLTTELRRLGHDVRILTRHPEPGAHDQYRWDISQNLIDPKALDGVDWVLNLAGESVTRRLWTRRFKKKLVDSRIDSNRLLIDSLIDRNIRCETFISASAVGYYGHRPDEIVNEESCGGKTFLAQLCKDWEHSADRANECAQQVTKVRIGIVLTSQDGPLSKMVATKRLGFIPYVGSGQTHLAWIHIDDLVKVFIHLLTTPYFGVFNACAPNSVTSLELAETLTSIVGGRTLQIPAPLARTLLADMSGLLLHSANVEPAALLDSHFEFDYPEIGAALKQLLT